MWDYLEKYKNNHTNSSLPQTTRSDASPDKRIWMKGPPTLNPLNWHCFRFALGHHLFQHPLSPLPYSRITFEATCGTISELGLVKLSSEFSTLASPHATQSTSSEDYPKGVVSARPYSEYLVLILFTNSEPNSPTLDTNHQTHTPFDPDLPRTSRLEVYSMLMT